MGSFVLMRREEVGGVGEKDESNDISGVIQFSLQIIRAWWGEMKKIDTVPLSIGL